MNVHIIQNTILNSCTYVISKNGCSEAYLIDCGDLNPIREYIETVNWKDEDIVRIYEDMFFDLKNYD